MLLEIGIPKFLVEFNWHQPEALPQFIRINRLPIIAFLHIEIAFGERASHLLRCRRTRNTHPSQLTYLRATPTLKSDKPERRRNKRAP